MPFRITSLWIASIALSVSLGAGPVRAITPVQIADLSSLIAAADYDGLFDYLLANPSVLEDIRVISPDAAAELDRFLQSGGVELGARARARLSGITVATAEASGVLEPDQFDIAADLTAPPPDDGLY